MYNVHADRCQNMKKKRFNWKIFKFRLSGNLSYPNYPCLRVFTVGNYFDNSLIGKWSEPN